MGAVHVSMTVGFRLLLRMYAKDFDVYSVAYKVLSIFVPFKL